MILALVAYSQPMDLRERLEPGIVWVQFTEGVIPSADAGKTGLATFDREGARFGIYEVRKAFQFVDDVTATREIAESTRALQRIYYVRHDPSFDSRQVASALARDADVVFAEPRFVSHPAWNGIPATTPSLPATPDDPLFSDTGYMQRLRMTDAWDVVKG